MDQLFALGIVPDRNEIFEITLCERSIATARIGGSINTFSTTGNGYRVAVIPGKPGVSPDQFT